MRNTPIGLLLLPLLLGTGACATLKPPPVQPVAAAPEHRPIVLARPSPTRHASHTPPPCVRPRTVRVRLTRTDKDRLFRSFSAEHIGPGSDRLLNCPPDAPPGSICRRPRF